MKYSFYIFISILSLIFSFTAQISEINHDSFKSYIESNRYNENKKLLLIFYKQNSTLCEEAINAIEKYIIQDYNSESEIEFGKINLDLDNNIWLYLQFNITRIPYVILIKGIYFYELNKKPDKYSIKEFINLSPYNMIKKKIPEEINTIRKILFVLKFTFRSFRIGFYNIFGISLNKNAIIFIFIIILCLIIWIIKEIMSFILGLFCLIKKIRIRKNNKEEDIVKIKEADNYSENLSGSDIGNKHEEDDNNDNDNTLKLKKGLFNQEMEEEELEKMKLGKID